MVLGPLDKRKRRTRCQSCTERRVKCQGGFPCQSCTRVGRICVPPSPTDNSTLIFAESMHLSQHGNGSTKKQSSSPICSAVPLDHETWLTSSFFSNFLAKNSFSGSDLENGPISSAYQVYPSLRNAVLAVAAMDNSRNLQNQVSLSRKTENFISLRAYQRAMLDLQRELTSPSMLVGDGCLWTTFFLGVFELMLDVSGEGWVKHALYGTSKIIQARGPQKHQSEPGRSFFLTVRVIEISRALIYNDSTYLSKPIWKELMRNMWTDSRHDWHLKEDFFDLMIDCIVLSCRGHGLDDRASQATIIPPKIVIMEMATEGLILQAAVNDWHRRASQSFCSSDPQLLLALIYYHGISIFLSGIYDYRTHWTGYLTPQLTEDEIQHHVRTILTMTEKALYGTNLAGILFFFPLRVAGARSGGNSVNQNRIITLLKAIQARNFVVAHAFVDDLRSLWSA